MEEEKAWDDCTYVASPKLKTLKEIDVSFGKIDRDKYYSMLPILENYRMNLRAEAVKWTKKAQDSFMRGEISRDVYWFFLVFCEKFFNLKRRT